MALTRINFLSTPGQIAPRAWLWLLPALALLAFAAYQWQQQQGQLQNMQDKLQAVQLQQAPPPRVQRSKEEQRALEAQALPLSQAVRQLNLPIPTLLQGLQPPPDIRVALLGVEFGGRSGTANTNAISIRLLAQAKSGADMANYVAYLDDQALFASAYLQKHEIAPDSKEGHYRFQMEVQWQP